MARDSFYGLVSPLHEAILVNNLEAFRRVETLIHDQNITFVSLQFTDIVGMVKQQMIPVSEFAEAVDHGIWFDGSSVEGFARIAESDMYLLPDLDTFTPIPYEAGDKTAT